jgi:ArsR family transcriptional regulator, cadmium/lead-responsive transcriptional repressor
MRLERQVELVQRDEGLPAKRSKRMLVQDESVGTHKTPSVVEGSCDEMADASSTHQTRWTRPGSLCNHSAQQGGAGVPWPCAAQTHDKRICLHQKILYRCAMEATLSSAPFRLPQSPAEIDLLAKYFRVLGDRTRLLILDLVGERERSVGELANLIGEPQQKISNHLACLRWCGFVASRREHRTVYYRPADARVAAVVDLGRELLHANADHIAACRHIDRSQEADGAR